MRSHAEPQTRRARQTESNSDGWQSGLRYRSVQLCTFKPLDMTCGIRLHASLAKPGTPGGRPDRLMEMETMNQMKEMNPWLIPQAFLDVADVRNGSLRPRQMGVFIGFISFIVTHNAPRVRHSRSLRLGLRHAFTPLREGGWRGAPGGRVRTDEARKPSPLAKDTESPQIPAETSPLLFRAFPWFFRIERPLVSVYRPEGACTKRPVGPSESFVLRPPPSFGGRSPSISRCCHRWKSLKVARNRWKSLRRLDRLDRFSCLSLESFSSFRFANSATLQLFQPNYATLQPCNSATLQPNLQLSTFNVQPKFACE